MKYSLLLLLAVSLCACGGNTKKSEAEKNNLKGKVKQVEESSFLVTNFEGQNVTEKELETKRQTNFNDEGNVTEETRFNADGTVYGKTTFTYKDGQRSEIKDAGEDNEEFSKTTFKYDGDGNAIESLITFKTGKTMKFTSKFDDKGNEIEIKQFDDNALVSTIKNTYDNNGNITKSEDTDAKGKVRVTEATYDANNKVLSEKVVVDGKEVGTRTYKNDENGNPVSETTIRNLGSGLKSEPEVVTYTYKYDAQKNWTSRTEYKDGEPVEVKERKVTYY